MKKYFSCFGYEIVCKSWAEAVKIHAYVFTFTGCEAETVDMLDIELWDKRIPSQHHIYKITYNINGIVDTVKLHIKMREECDD